MLAYSGTTELGPLLGPKNSRNFGVVAFVEHASIMETCPNPNQHNLNLLFLNTKCRENAATVCICCSVEASLVLTT